MNNNRGKSMKNPDIIDKMRMRREEKEYLQQRHVENTINPLLPEVEEISCTEIQAWEYIKRLEEHIRRLEAELADVNNDRDWWKSRALELRHINEQT